MPRYRVFISSPADVADERERARRALLELDRMFSDIQLVAWTWEDEVPPGDGAPQAVVDRWLDTYDVYVGIMWSRVGTPTPTAESGTISEYRMARAALSEGRVRHVMFYFCDRDVPIDRTQQVEAVRRFRDELSATGIRGHYRDPEDFEAKFRGDLGKIVQRLRDDDAAAAAAAQSPPQEAGVAEEEPLADLVELRIRLEAKLVWLAKHLFGSADQPACINVGSLRNDGYLTPDQARVATRVMTGDAGRIATDTQPEIFSGEASRVVASLRVIVFDALTKQLAQKAGWSVDASFDRRPGHRPDFLIRRDERVVRVAARLSTKGETDLIKNTLNRLERGNDDPPNLDARNVVVPNTSRYRDDPRVLRLEDFEALLAS